MWLTFFSDDHGKKKKTCPRQSDTCTGSSFNPVSGISSKSWMDQLSNMMGYLGNFPEFAGDPYRITMELSRGPNVIVLAT